MANIDLNQNKWNSRLIVFGEISRPIICTWLASMNGTESDGDGGDDEEKENERTGFVAKIET